MFCYSFPDLFQLIPVRHVDSRSDENFSRLDVEIVPRSSCTLRFSSQYEMRRNVSLIGAFILAESNVLVDTEEGAFRIDLILRRKGLKVWLKGGNERLHGKFHKRHIIWFMFLKPIPPVILLELSQKGYPLLGETIKWGVEIQIENLAGRHGHSFLIC